MILVAIIMVIIFFVGVGATLRFAGRLIGDLLDINHRVNQEVRRFRR